MYYKILRLGVTHNFGFLVLVLVTASIGFQAVVPAFP